MARTYIAVLLADRFGSGGYQQEDARDRAGLGVCTIAMRIRSCRQIKEQQEETSES